MSAQVQSLASSLLPGDGLLPKWLLFLSVVSIGNSIQAYSSLAGTRQVYAGRPGQESPVTELSARTFGTWTFISAIVRMYTAYHINERAFYQLGLWTFIVAWAHFMSEWLLFGTARWNRGLVGPAIVATVTPLWMFAVWDRFVV